LKLVHALQTQVKKWIRATRWIIPGLGGIGCFLRNWIWLWKSGIPTAHRRTPQTLRSIATRPTENAQAKETYAKLSNLVDEFRSKQMHPNYNGVHRLVTKL
jgi:hypothetical protein